jgi:hypothetical protein
MTEIMEEHSKESGYYVVSVEKANPPEGMSGSNWHRYIIQRGEQKIEGLQPGRLKEVTKHAEAFAESLNERFAKSGYTYGTRKKK